MIDDDDQVVLLFSSRMDDIARLARGLSDPSLAYDRVWDLAEVFVRLGAFEDLPVIRSMALAAQVVRSELQTYL